VTALKRQSDGYGQHFVGTICVLGQLALTSPEVQSAIGEENGCIEAMVKCLERANLKRVLQKQS